ncbi:MAG: neprosin family prolyl endopeptidase [Gammaproteobacteria bacterium]|jgi:hypothetical protein|nr:neprosin family prolyl endopeptidase [Gammaproteobacteria bacterium]|tara:strand:- start:19 stop:1443 length:1425 start_codon:yes stop_codon:yes gene_type:complete
MKNLIQCLVTRSGLVATALLPLFLGVHSVAAAAVGIASYSDFIKGVRYAQFEQFENRINSEVMDKQAFTAMQKHILKHYRGVKITNSFLGQSGSPIDCVTIKSQPSLQSRKMRGHKLATPPKALTRADQRSAKRVKSGKDIKPQLSRKMKDLYGNTMYCGKGTIPMRRLTLETLTRFETLDDFFSKGPGDALQRAEKRKEQSSVQSKQEEIVPGDDDATHYWAHARQTVDNHGGDSRLNVWRPDADPGEFSLSQHWYVGGTGANKQTVEGGWHVYDWKYENSNPNLFIFSTSAGYSVTDPVSKCYNLDCAAFVQINNSWVLGGELGPVSTTGGTQYIFRMQWQLHNGNWWLFLKGRGSAEPGVANYHAVGYYPEEWFNGGQLTQHATKIDYGGEVASHDENTGEMGGGKHAVEGWQQAAYQRTIYYIDLAQKGQWANLTKVNGTPDCYTADLHNQTGTTWATYLYFGGPECPAP